MSKWFQFSVKGGIVPLMGLLPALALANPRSDIDMPANKQLGSVFNDDGANILERLWADETTPEQYLRAVLRLLDARPGVMAMCVGLPDPVWYSSDVATMIDELWPKHYKTQRAGCFEALRAAGTDPLTLNIEACRQRQIPFVASFRMNSEDHADKQLDIYRFGSEHRDWRIPNAQCLDPAIPEVFAHRMAIFREIAMAYDIDGIEFDFRRWWHMISDPHENHAVLTRMVRETRQMLDAVAREKGRQRLLLGVRVGPSLDTPPQKAAYAGMGGAYANPSCRDLGLDVPTWIREELVDYVCPTLFWPKWPGLPYIEEFVELARNVDVGIYPTLWPIPGWINEGPIEIEDTTQFTRYKNEFCRIALQIYDQGAHGISTYNWTPHMEPGIFRNPGRMDWGMGAKQVQMELSRRLGSRAAIQQYLEQSLP